MPRPLSMHKDNSQIRFLQHEHQNIVSRGLGYPDALVVYALIIINKAGGLIYNRDFSSPLSKLTSNDYLVLAGTFHGVHAITRSLTPSPIAANIPRSLLTGLEVLETSNFRLTCFQAPTGVKFLLFTEPHQPNCDTIVAKIYEFYADYVMKNPFYALEMPVRCEEFDRRLGAWIRGR
ncbi:MAG: hypothetical protein LQ344_005650 [Seirophora lacunosa]|nr:MAG: hypothetical protein LQ344_005650 [Seirophora lacunosa]